MLDLGLNPEINNTLIILINRIFAKNIYRDQGKIMMKIRKPNMMANIWSSGKIVCQGARSEDDAMKGARR